MEFIAATPDEQTVVDCIRMELKHKEASVLEYRARYAPAHSGPVRYGVRVIPTHPGLTNKHEPRLIRWS